MTLAVQLLGVPRVQRGDADVPATRGHKVWGLLAYLALADAPPTRQHLSEVLFPDADDPVRALRWNLSQLRRVLGPGAVVEGDPVTLTLPPGTVIDAHVVTTGSWADALRLPGLGRELLEGLPFATTPAFELWLATQRRHLAGAAAAALREAVLHYLARGNASAAADHASRLVTLDQFDENAHILLVRSLRAAGERAAAKAQVSTCTELFRRELGVAPSPALRVAADASAHGEPTPWAGRRSAPSSMPVRPRSAPARSRPAWPGCDGPRSGPEPPTSPTCSPSRSSPSAAPWSTPHAAATRKAPPRSTRPVRSLSRSATAPRPRSPIASSATSTCCADATSGPTYS